MALTLAEAAKLSNDLLLTGVIETIIYDSPVLQGLPFIETGWKQWEAQNQTWQTYPSSP